MSDSTLLSLRHSNSARTHNIKVLRGGKTNELFIVCDDKYPTAKLSSEI